jgi:hypothetical protein
MALHVLIKKPSAGLKNGAFPERPGGQGEPLWKKLAFAAEFAENTKPPQSSLYERLLSSTPT